MLLNSNDDLKPQGTPLLVGKILNQIVERPRQGDVVSVLVA